MTVTESEATPTLAEKIDFLRNPGSYPGGAAAVETVETHMSWVFLAEDRAYKLKKPVRYEFLDFSTPEKRREDCRAEVRLNRRLAPGVYLGVTALTLREGELALDGGGRPVDWLTRMVRLPRDLMLDHSIRRGRVDEDRLREAARRLGRFYRDAEPVSLDLAEFVDRLRALVTENREELTRPEFGLETDRADGVGKVLERYLDEREEDVRARIRAGRVVEGHGDLRPEHVCLREEPVFIDCIEFEREFRIVDPVDELAFLGVECELLGAPGVGRTFMEEYRTLTDDAPPRGLVEFYRSHRAYLRAKLTIWHVRDDGVTDADRERWRGRTREYLDLAAAHLPL